MSGQLEQLAVHIEASHPDAVTHRTLANGELGIEVAPGALLGLVSFLTKDATCDFRTLVDVTAIDHPGQAQRFTVVYHFLSMSQNHRIRIKTRVGENQILPSIMSIHPSANWFEREVFDMFGILFSGHADMRRILTDYGFHGHPLRKDFPTTGYVEVRYDETRKRVVHEPVTLVQEYRQFDFMSPWEGAQYVLPDDDGKKTDAKE